jgi:hypothetical protein
MDSSDKMIVIILAMFFTFILGLSVAVVVDEQSKRAYHVQALETTEDPVALALILGKSH